MDKRSDGRLAIGRLGSPHGVHGDLKVTSYSGEFAHFLGLNEVDLEAAAGEALPPRGGRALLGRAISPPGRALPGRAVSPPGRAGAAASGRAAAGQADRGAAPGRSERGAAPRSLHLGVRRIEEGPGGLVMAFVGYDSPEAARALTGMEIVVPREQAAPLGPNEWYVVDLVGLRLVSAGESLAVVGSVLEGGSDPWLEAELPDGRRALVPFRKEFVGEVDLDAGTIELLSPWLLEP